MTTTEIISEQQLALARLDAFSCEHGLPPYQRAWLRIHDADHMRICPDIDPTVLHVFLTERAHVNAWAVALGATRNTEHVIYEYEDGRWCAVWNEVTRVDGWLPGVRLSVGHSEDRWIERPS